MQRPLLIIAISYLIGIIIEVYLQISIPFIIILVIINICSFFIEKYKKYIFLLPDSIFWKAFPSLPIAKQYNAPNRFRNHIKSPRFPFQNPRYAKHRHKRITSHNRRTVFQIPQDRAHSAETTAILPTVRKYAPPLFRRLPRRYTPA